MHVCLDERIDGGEMHKIDMQKLCVLKILNWLLRTWHLLPSTDTLFTLSSGVNVPCLGNKNNLERQLPQVKLCAISQAPLCYSSPLRYFLFILENLNNCCYVRLELA